MKTEITDFDALDFVINKTDLYVYVTAKDKQDASTWGKAISFDKTSGIVKFSRYEHKKMLGKYVDALMDCFLSTEAHHKEVYFAILEQASRDNKSWKRNRMDHLVGEDWIDLYRHLTKGKWERFKEWLQK